MQLSATNPDNLPPPQREQQCLDAQRDQHEDKPAEIERAQPLSDAAKIDPVYRQIKVPQRSLPWPKMTLDVASTAKSPINIDPLVACVIESGSIRWFTPP
jgi:hypothetical protein